MEIETLNLHWFGRFHDDSIVLPPGTRFAVIHGGNGAGKTTLLHSIRSLFFGIPERTSYQFPSHPSAPRLCATLRDREGSLLRIERQKRRKDSLTGIRILRDGTELPVTDDTFAQYFGNTRRELYSSVFGFTLRDLEEGAAILKDQTVNDLLAGGALGGDGQRVKQVKTRLAENMTRLWVDRGHNQPINEQRKMLDELQRQRNGHMINEKKYGDIRSAFERAKVAVKQLDAEHARLLARKRRFEQMLQIHADWRELRDLEARHEAEPPLPGVLLSASSSLPGFTPGTDGAATNALAPSATVLSLLDQAEETHGTLRDIRVDADALETRMGSMPEDKELLAVEDAIKSLFRKAEHVASLRKSVSQADERVARESGRPSTHGPVFLPHYDDLLLPQARFYLPSADHVNSEELDGDSDISVLENAAYSIGQAATELGQLRGMETEFARARTDVRSKILAASQSRERELLALKRLLNPDFAVEPGENLDGNEVKVPSADATSEDIGNFHTVPASPKDTSLYSDILGTLLNESPIARSRHQELVRLRRTIAEARIRYVSTRSKLLPTIPAAMPAQIVPLPPRDAVIAVQDRARIARSGVDSAKASVRQQSRLTAQLHAAAEALAMDGDRSGPTRDEVRIAREQRETAWHLWLSRATSPVEAMKSPESDGEVFAFAEEYSEMVRAADELADRRFAAADFVATLAGKRREHAEAAALLLADQADLSESERVLAAALEQWDALWRETEKVVSTCPTDESLSRTSFLTPDELAIPWLDAMLVLQSQEQELERLREEIAATEVELSPFIQDAFRFLGIREADISDRDSLDHGGTDVERLLTFLDIRRQQAEEVRLRRLAAEERIEEISQQIKALSAEEELLEEELAAVARSTENCLLATGLVIPSAPLADAFELFDRLRTSVARRIDMWERRQQVAEQRKEIEQFDQMADGLDARLIQHRRSSDLTLRIPAEEWIYGLHDTLAASRSAAAARAELAQRLGELQKRVARLEGEEQTIERSLSVWRTRAGAQDNDSLRKLAVSAMQRDKDEERRATLLTILARGLELPRIPSRTLSGTGTAAGEAGADAVPASPASEADPLSVTEQMDLLTRSEIEHLLADAVEQISKNRDEHLRSAGDYNESKSRVDALGSDNAVVLNARCAGVRAELSERTAEFTRNYVAYRVLSEVMERFTRENQPLLLQIASDLIRRVTDGRFVRVVQDLEGKNLALETAPTSSGALPEQRLPDHLSTGEREQMFLTLRLAYALRYCARAEPLPIILDDVLVNFDERRMASTLRALDDVSKTTQVLFFTCHEQMLRLVNDTVPHAAVHRLQGA